ncbi:MAG: hydrogenase maturation protease [Roseicyclus sp.]|nr:hydrogenase maturation protease [Roseicyclus sp.]
MKPLDIVVIGCGNPNRSDDGVGPHVVRLLREKGVPDNVRVFDGGTDGMGIMYSARGATHLIIVDARIPEGSPGAIYEVPGEVLEAPPKQSLNLHDFRWDNALYAGKRIYGDDFPKSISVLLIEAASLELGLGLSEEVTVAADLAESRIRDTITEWLAA